jgi:hypothetical protein
MRLPLLDLVMPDAPPLQKRHDYTFEIAFRIPTFIGHFPVDRFYKNQSRVSVLCDKER